MVGILGVRVGASLVESVNYNVYKGWFLRFALFQRLVMIIVTIGTTGAS
jgi:hypothetical protein